MSYRILNIKEKKEWTNILGKLSLDQQDIYYTPEYYELCEINGDGQAICFVLEKDEDIAMYPFLMNSVNNLGYDLDNTYYDIQGAYGYNGWVCSSLSSDFLRELSNSFTNYCHHNNIIAEFTRFNPVITNHMYSEYLNIVKTNRDIILNVQHSEKHTWENIYDHSVRKNVKKAMRSGLIVNIYSGDDISEYWSKQFTNIYTSTLKRRNADKFYYFSEKYFSLMNKLLRDNVIYFFTVKDDIVISCELVTIKNNNAYSFLGGTLSEYFPYRPNDLLKHEIINYLRSINVKNFCMGGGSEDGDGIYKYKKSFSKNGSTDFFIGKKIYNEKIYNKICQEWMIKNPKKIKDYENILLKYRE